MKVFKTPGWRIRKRRGVLLSNIHKFRMKSKDWFLPIIGVFMMMTTTVGCMAGKTDVFKVPGNPLLNEYRAGFELDWDVFESGTYSYGPDGSRVHRIPGGRFGYQSFFDLTFDFKFKDGREYHEKIDIRLLIREMEKNHEIFDLTTTKWGGSAALKIRIQKDTLVIDYQVTEYIEKENPRQTFFNRRRYPVFRKTLD